MKNHTSVQDNQKINGRLIREITGLGLDRVVKATLFITDMREFGEINEVYAHVFGDHKPARSCVEVSALPKGALVELECIAWFD